MSTRGQGVQECCTLLQSLPGDGASLPVEVHGIVLQHGLAALLHILSRHWPVPQPLLGEAVAASMACLRVSAQLSQKKQKVFAYEQPVATAAAALLAHLLGVAHQRVSPLLFDNISECLLQQCATQNLAGLMALLVSLEAYTKPAVAAYVVSDTLAAVLHVLSRAQLNTCEPSAQYLAASSPAVSLAVLCVRCLESVMAQPAAFRQLGAAGPLLLPAVLALMQQLESSRSGQASTRAEEHLLVLAGACAAVAAAVRRRPELLPAACGTVAACARSALRSLQRLAARAPKNSRSTRRCFLVPSCGTSVTCVTIDMHGFAFLQGTSLARADSRDGCSPLTTATAAVAALFDAITASPAATSAAPLVLRAYLALLSTSPESVDSASPLPPACPFSLLSPAPLSGFPAKAHMRTRGSSTDESHPLAGGKTLEEAAQQLVAALSATQLQHLHVSLSAPQHLFSRRALALLKQHHEERLRFKGKV